MSRNIRQDNAEEITSQLLQKWEQLDIKMQAAPLLHFSNEHPVITLFLGVLAGLCVLPLLLFLMFVVMTFMLTFLGFLLIEGILLSFATIILSITLFGIICTSFFITSFLVLVWFSITASNLGMQKLKEVIKMQDPIFHEQDTFK
jgi:hypothetical protein